MLPLSYFNGFRPLFTLLTGSVAWASLLGFPAIALGPPQILALQYNPPNRGAPGRTESAGSRGPCVDLTAVQPTQTNWGTTLRARPTFGIYASGNAKDLTFELQDEISKEILYTVVLDSIAGPGISLYTLPEAAPALEPGRAYRWQVRLDCGQFSTALIQSNGTKQTGGVISRHLANEDLVTTLATAMADEQPALLAANGIWYDAVHALLLQRLAQPEVEAWTEAWQTLLTHPMVQLKLMDANPIECCLALLDCLPDTDKSQAAPTGHPPKV